MSLFLQGLKKGKYFVISLFLILIILPFKNVIIEPTNTPRFILISIVLFLFLLIHTIRKKSLRLPPFYLSILLFSFYLINLISCFWSLNVADSLYESQKIFIGILTITILLITLENDKNELILIKSLMLISIICASYAIYEIAQNPDFSLAGLYEVHSFFGHKNLLTSFLFLSLAFPIYGYNSFNRNWKIISIITFIALIALIFLLQNRTVYVATLISLGLISLFHLQKIVNHKKKAILIIVLCSIPVLMLINSKSINTSNIELISHKGLASFRERTAIWNKTTQLIQDNPILGVGSGNWQYNYSKYSIGDIKKIVLHDKSFKRPHNDFLWILSETGIVGFCLFTLILLFFIKHAYSKIRSGTNKKVLILFSFLTGLLIISCFSFPKERITHILLVSAILSLLVKNLDLKYNYINSKKLFVTSLLLTILCFNIVMGTYRLRGEYFTNLLLVEKNENNPNNVIGYGKKATSFFYKTDPTSTPIASYIGWGYNALNNIDSLHFYTKKACNLAPYDYEVLTNYGYVLSRIHQTNSAKEILLESYRINPRFESTLINLMVLEYNNQNYKEALRWLTSIPDHKKKHEPYLIKIKEKLDTPN